MVGIVYKTVTSDERPVLGLEFEAAGEDSRETAILMWDALRRPC